MYTNKSGDNDVMKSIDGFDVFNSKYILWIDNLPESDTHKITENTERLDLLVYKNYNSYEYYGLIGVLNRIDSPSELGLGVIIKMPTYDQINNVTGGFL